MRRTALIILGIAGGLVALVLIAVAIAVATVDVNSFAEPLAARVTAATGRPFKLGGPLALHLSLEPTLRAEQVTLGNAPWGKSPIMISVGRVEAQVALLPLLHRRFEIVRVTLVDPVINLETDKEGRGNWVFGAQGAPQSPSSPGEAAAPALGVGEVEIRNGTVSYRDGATGKVTPIAIDLLTVHARNPDTPISGEFRGTVDGIPLAIKANLGSRAALLAQQWPYPVEVKGEIAGRNATLATKLTQAPNATKLDDLTLALGDLVVQGSVAVERGGPRPRYVIDVRMPRFAPEALALPALAAGKPQAAKPPAPSASHHLIPDQPLPLGVLRDIDAQGHVAIGTLALPHGEALERVELRFTLRGGRLDVTELGGAGLGGSMSARGTIQARDAASAAIDVHLEGRDLELKPVLALIGSPRDVSGGKTRATLDAKASGASLHDFASTMDGTIAVLVGPAQLRNASGASNATLDRIGAAVNPFRKTQSATELRCAVVRLPVRDGVARVDRTIAAETAELGVSASGTLDLRNETMDLTLKPQLRQGIPINVTGLADVVRVRGPFNAPQLSIDPVKSAETVARIGAAIGTGGWSLLGETLLNVGAASDSPCAIALGAKPSAAQAPGTAQKGTLPAEVGKALGKLFGR